MPKAGKVGEPVLCLEVWLGPMEGLRHTAVASGGEALIRVGRRRVDEKRSLRNDFTLAEGEGISSFHAEVRCSGGKLFLKDLKSTNGSFVRNKPVAGEVEIESGEVFLLSTTPLRAEVVAEPRTEISPPPRVEDEAAGSSAVQKLLATMRDVARSRREPYVDTRHLADAILKGEDTIVRQSLQKADVTPARAVEKLWDGGFFPEPLAWIRRFLAERVDSRGRTDPPPLSPRVRALVAAVSARLEGRAPMEVDRLAASTLLAALLASSGPVGEWLRGLGVRAEMPPAEPRGSARKTARAAKPGREPSAATEESLSETAPRREAPSVAPPAAAPPPRREPRPAASRDPAFATTGDVVLDQRAREIAVELDQAATLYRFSTPEDRRAAMKAQVHHALAAIAPENRTRILNQIRAQFPVVGSVPSAAPPPESRLAERVRELEAEVERLRKEAKEKVPSARGASKDVPWRSLISAQPPDPAEGAELALVYELVSFARQMEKFLLGLVQGVTAPGDATMNFRLPGHRYTLEGLLSTFAQGKQVEASTLSEYLRELERWQVAILAAYHEAPRRWFDKLWKRASPTAIEVSTARQASWKMRNEAAEWWNRYKETVEGLTPDVVQDQVLQTTFRLAQEEYEKLSKRRSP